MQKAPRASIRAGLLHVVNFARAANAAREETLFRSGLFGRRSRSSGALGAFSGALFRFGVRLAFFRIVAVLPLH